jgi:imidazolonepropionase-like amidohydrolase
MTAPILHLTGPVVVDTATEAPEAWVIDGRITFARPAGADRAVRVDGFAFPGLVDMHCHVGLDSGGSVDPDLSLKQAIVNRDAGTLLIRDAGSASDTRFLQDRTDTPRLIRAGRFIARPMRYLRGYAIEIEVADLPRVAAEQARAGDGWVKIIADWIDRDLGEQGDLTPLWPADVLADAVAAVHAEGARVTAHTFATESIGPLLDAGIDCLEHGTGMTSEHMVEAAQRGIPVVPTLLQVAHFESFAAQASAKYPLFAARMAAMHERRYAQVRELADAGVTLLMGTDAGGTIGHGSLPEEAAEWVKAGIPAADVVASATWKPREFLGVRGLEEGASADAVVFAADPRGDIGALAAPQHVILQGTRRT